ncbi:MAG: twin-arginine translocase TatA/TatE family subunit [Pseudomonadota bacterium]
MGIGGISIWQLLIVLVIVVLLFGTKRLRGLGGDLGSALKSFRNAVSDAEKEEDEKGKVDPQLAQREKAQDKEDIIEGEVSKKTTST